MKTHNICKISKARPSTVNENSQLWLPYNYLHRPHRNLVNQKYSHSIGIIQHRVETQNNKPTFRCTMSLPVELQTMWLLTSLKTNTTTREKQYLLTKDSHYYNCNCQQYIYIQDN